MIVKKRKGISTFIATLLLMVLAVSAGVVIYAYVMGYLGGFGGPQTMGAISIDTYNIAADGSTIEIWIRNIGKTTFTLQNVYIDGAQILPANFDALTLGETEVGQTTIHWQFDSLTHAIKLIGVDNTQISTNVKK